MLPQTVPITEIVEETPTVKTFVLEARLPEAQPGQFVMLWLPGVDEKPISIAHPDPLTLTVARVGPFSTALHACRPGDRLGWRGPFGRPFRLRPDRPAVLVGGGYGAAPLYFLAQRAVEAGIPTTVVLGARTADALIFVRRFRQLQAQEAAPLHLLLATDDGSGPVEGHPTFPGLATEALRAYLADHPADPPPVLYGCGPEPMLVALYHLAREEGLEAQLSVERYMKCGFGVCGQCALDGLLVCLDGPVLTLDQLEGVADFGRFHRTTTGRRLPLGTR